MPKQKFRIRKKIKRNKLIQKLCKLVVKKGKESDKKWVIIMLIFQRQKLPFENMPGRG